MNHNGKSLKINAAISDFFKEINAEDKLTNTRLKVAWKNMMGPGIEQQTKNLYLKNDTLFIVVSSAALRHTLQHSKFDLLKKLNKALHPHHILDVKVL